VGLSTDQVRDNTWFPWATGILIGLLYLAARLFPGYWTWPFNAVAYWPGAGGAVFTGACLVLLLLATRFLPRLEAFHPAPFLEVAVFFALALVFLAAVAYGPVWVPSLEGDGDLQHDDSAVRLANLLVGWVQDQTGLEEAEASAVAWRVMACVYIAGAAAFASEMFTGFWPRLTGFLFLASFPSVVNFSGHYDNYSVTYTCLSFAAGLAFLAARRRSAIFLAASALAFLLSVKAHRYAAIFLVYPFFWVLLRLLDRRGVSRRARAAAIAASLAALLLLGVLVAVWGIPFYARGEDFGRWLSVVRRSQGLLPSLAVPLLLLASFLSPYLLVLVAAAAGRHRSRPGDAAVTAALLGSLAIALLYYEIQVLNPVSCYGMLDFVCQSGSLGGLFAVPALVVAAGRFPRRIYCCAFLSLSLLVPQLVLQSGPRALHRLMDSLGDDLSEFFIDRSPYPFLGRKLRFASQRRPELRALSVEVYEQGMAEKGFYRPFAPLSAFSMMDEQYQTGETASARFTLEKLLSRWPRAAVFLIISRPETFRPFSDGLFTELARMSAWAEAISGESIYERIVLSLKTEKSKIVHPTPREYASVLIALDALRHADPSPLAGPALVEALQVLERFSLGDLLQEPSVVPSAPPVDPSSVPGGS
jgi:hypothetical protein